MDYSIGRSSHNHPGEAVTEATKGFRSPKLILSFSGVDKFEEYQKELADKYPDSIVMGSTSYVGLCKEGAFKEQLVVLGIEEGIECYAGVLEEIDRYPLRYIDRVKKCCNNLSSTQNSVCIEFSTAMLCSEESVLATLNSVLQEKKIPLIGGTAGDNGSGGKTMVALNGIVREKSCVFVMIHSKTGRIRFYRENMYKPTKHQFDATKVDIEKRIVYEYNHRPAAQCMAEALHTTVADLDKYLGNCPMGRIVGDETYITANCAVIEKNAMSYHARVYNNSKMVLLEADDYKKVLAQTLERAAGESKGKTLTFMVHCLGRSVLFDGDGYLDTFAKEAGKKLGDYIGLSGYGEQLNQQNFNQTMIFAVFE